jgi:hypothetical protein
MSEYFPSKVVVNMDNFKAGGRSGISKHYFIPIEIPENSRNEINLC